MRIKEKTSKTQACWNHCKIKKTRKREEMAEGCPDAPRHRPSLPFMTVLMHAFAKVVSESGSSHLGFAGLVCICLWVLTQ